MGKQLSKPALLFMSLLAVITWLSLAIQLYGMTASKISNPGAFFYSAWNFFSYFTILTNLLVALCLSFQLLRPYSAAGRFFAKPTVQAAIVIYIFLVGLVYNLLLRSAWRPTGPQLWADEALHVFIPLLFIFFWIWVVPKGSLNRLHPFLWLSYPAAYLAYALARGEFTGFHAYPFINTKKLGYGQVLTNAGGLMVVLIMVGFILVGADHLLSRSKKQAFS